jgi:uncharacterized protein (DUF952 family)
MLPILHLVSLDDWRVAVDLGEYRPASLETEGFIHFSTADQVAATAQRFYTAVPDLALVLVDGDGYDVSFEEPTDAVAGGWDELFPHVHRPVDPSSILGLSAYRPGAPWALPDEFMRPASIDGLRFVAAETTGEGQVSAATLFDYSEPGDGTISATYSGGPIIEGHLIGWRALDRMRFRYVQVLDDGDIAVGQCQTRILVDGLGRTELIEKWRWLGREGSGTSRMVATSPNE